MSEDISKNKQKEQYFGIINANTYQAAILNKLLPAGFRIEAEENALKNF
jgi:hypothetical protein